MSNFDHIFLYCLMFLLAIIYDKIYRRNRWIAKCGGYVEGKNLTVIGLLLAVVFIFTEGYRYARGVDMLGNYGPFYLHCMQPASTLSNDGLFLWLTRAFHEIDLTLYQFPFGSIFVFYALIFWLCFWAFYQDYKKESVLFLVLGILATNYLTEWTIRQGVSFSFVFLGLHFLEKKNFKWVLICAIVAFLIHKGNALAIILLGVSWLFLNKKPLPWKIVVPIFIVLEYTSQQFHISEFIQNLIMASGLQTGEHFEGYMNAEYTDYEAEVAAEWQRGFATQLITVAFYSAVMIIGSMLHEKKNNHVYIFNAFVIGIMIFEPFRLAGTLTRMFMPLAALWFVPLAIAIYYRKHFIKERRLMSACFIVTLAYIVMYYGRYVFLNPEAKYVWDIIKS